MEAHYENKAESIHIMGLYAQLMQNNPVQAQEMVKDYFNQDLELFRMKWMGGERRSDAVSDALRAKIEGALDAEQAAVIRSRHRHILVAAGPGSGKTHLLVHKAASLLWMEQAKPESLLILTYTRAACLQLRKRLIDLAGDLARGVRIQTFHGFAFTVLGLRGDLLQSEKVVARAADLLGSEDCPEIGAPSVLMVDEYQDLSDDEYRLLRAIYDLGEKAPRIIAVGDDDQNIYEFRGANSLYFRRFADEFANAKVFHLTTNYRSNSGIVEQAEALLPCLQDRVKSDVRLRASRQGKAELQWIETSRHASYACAECITKESRHWGEDSVGVLAPHNIDLYRIAAGLQENGCKFRHLRHSSRDRFSICHLREVIAFRELLLKQPQIGAQPFTPEEFRGLLDECMSQLDTGTSWEMVRCMVDDYLAQEANPTLYSWDAYVQEVRPQDLAGSEAGHIQLSTMHAAKGLQWDRVVLCLDNWKPQDAQSFHLLYVACTRARKSITVVGNTEGMPAEWLNMFTRHRLTQNPKIPRSLEMDLGMSDVYLGHYLKDDHYGHDLQKILSTEKGGSLLTVPESHKTALLSGKLYALWYSSSFQEKAMQWLAQDGYSPESAKLMHVCRWKDPNTAKERWVPLVKLKLSR